MGNILGETKMCIKVNVGASFTSPLIGSGFSCWSRDSTKGDMVYSEVSVTYTLTDLDVYPMNVKYATKNVNSLRSSTMKYIYLSIELYYNFKVLEF